METAPLSLAYSHARSAVHETQKANPIAASEEHDLAAGEFANAARSTGDLEALRTLRLLEQHHQRLAELLKYKPEVPASLEDGLDQDAIAQSGALSTVIEESGNVVPKKTTEESQRQASRHVPLSPEARHHRELSSSIASNLASARGIQPKTQRRSLQSPASPTVTTQNADGRMTTSEERRDSKRMSRGYDRRSQGAHIPGQSYKHSTKASDSFRTSPTRSSTAHIPPSIIQPGTDDAFTRFYNHVESLGTRLSAALAFTGLPLGSPTSEDPAPSSEPTEKQPPPLPRDKSRTTPSTSPDVSRFFSRAALKAAREEGGGAGVAESFYVVPTSGGTMSYAGMLQGQRQGSGLAEAGADEEFVDASEVPVHGSFEGDGSVTSTGHRKRSRAGSLWKESSSKTTSSSDKGKDEVRRELEYWKAMARDTGERLKAFEMNAQRESIMAASIYRGGGGARSRHHSPESVRAHAAPASPPAVPKIPAHHLPPPNDNSDNHGLTENAPAESTSSGVATLEGGGEEEDDDPRIRELEDEVAKSREMIKRCQKENRKLMAVVEKYRKRFEDLKENARERMRAQEEEEEEQQRAKAQQQSKDGEEGRKDQMMG